jgi:hypothetical protein
MPLPSKKAERTMKRQPMPPEDSMAAWLGIDYPDQARSQKNVAAIMGRIGAYEAMLESRKFWLGWIPTALALATLLAVLVLPTHKAETTSRSSHDEAVALFAEEFSTPL